MRGAGARGEAGQTTVEYVGMVGLVAAIVAVLLSVAQLLGLPVAGTVASAYCHVGQAVGVGGGCSSDTPGPDGPEDQPWYCDVLGIGCHDDDNADTGDQDGGANDDQPWYCDLFGLGCHDDGSTSDHGDHGDVDIPDGLDPDSELVKAMLSTERGRETLQWLADHDVPIVIDASTTGAYWDGTQIVLGDGLVDPSTLVHEANHAKYTYEGRHADAGKLSKDDYVHDTIAEEADGTVQEIQAAQEFRDAGHDVPKQPGEDQYNEAYDNAKDNGASDAEAEQAGYDAVEQEFYNGGFVTSTNGQSYPDYYGDYWESVH
jgi:hypothetical protein